MQLQTSCIALRYWDTSKRSPVLLKKIIYHECDTKWSSFPTHVLPSKMADLRPNFRWPEKHLASFNWKKWMEENRRMRRNRSAWKMKKKAPSAFLQDSSKSLEDKCVYTRLDVFTWISIVSIPQGIIKNHQSGQCFQKIWTCVANLLNSSKDSKNKSN